MASSPSSKKMTSKSYDVEVEDAEAAAAAASQPINHLDLSAKLTELISKSSDGKALGVEEAAAALDSQWTVEHGKAPSPNVSSEMTLKSSDVEVEEEVAPSESQPLKHLDLSDKLSEVTLKSSDGEAAASESQPIVEHGKAPLLNASSRKITLRSMDGKLFEVEEAVAMMSETIKKLDEIDGVVSLPRVRGYVLAKVIDYCNKHVDYPQSDDPGVNEEIKNWDADFLEMDLDTLTYLVGAAGYLKLNSLEDLTWRALTDIQNQKTAEFIRETVKKEKEKIRKEENA